MQIVTDAVSAGETRYEQVGNRLVTITGGQSLNIAKAVFWIAFGIFIWRLD